MSQTSSLPFRPCVGIVVFNKMGKVWAGRRLVERDDENVGATKLWQLPQGGIDEGEDAQAAARRELWEETGIKSVEYLTEIAQWLEYDLPPERLGIALGGKYRGQRQKWFAFLFVGDEEEVNIHTPPEGNKPEFDAWDWVDLETLPMMVVPFKQAVYEAIVLNFRPLLRQFETG